MSQPPAEAGVRPRARGLSPLTPIGSITLVVLGVYILVFAQALEADWQRKQPWSQGLLVPEAATVPEGAYAAQVRRVPRDNFPALEALAASFAEYGQAVGEENFASRLGLADTEWLVALDLPRERWVKLVAEGRAPAEGAHEVLAGPLARLDTFAVNGVQFNVVGQLPHGISGLAFAYVLPAQGADSAVFTGEEVRSGYVHPEGVTLIETLFPDLIDESTKAAKDTLAEEPSTTVIEAIGAGDGQTWPRFVGGMSLTAPPVTRLALLGTILAVLGLTWFHIIIYRGLARAPWPWLRAAFTELLEHRRVWTVLCLIFYGTFFGAAIPAIRDPLLHLGVTRALAHEFTEGGLGYIGEAFATGNPVTAALAIWFNNYVVQTLGLTLGLSVFFGLGLVKTWVSFALVGFAMTPLWTELVPRLWFHVGTIGLELNAYILACFLVVAVAMRMKRAVIGREPAQWLPMAQILVGGAVVVGAQLLVAAFYEAATLLLLG